MSRAKKQSDVDWTPCKELKTQALILQEDEKRPDPFRIEAIKYTIKNNLPYPKELIEWAKAKARE